MIKPNNTMELLYNMDSYTTDIPGRGVILIEESPFLISIDSNGAEHKCHLGNTKLEEVVYAELFCSNPRCRLAVDRGEAYIHNKPIEYYTKELDSAKS